MENNKQQDLSDDDYKQESPSNTWNPTKETDNSPGDIKSRKRKIESEPSENGKSISTETVLVANRENTPFFADQPSSDLYGLKPEFLKSLGINLPLSKWVYVTNFRCDKSELKDVFELAGHVVICSMIAVRNRYANVMFNHPLEAVQLPPSTTFPLLCDEVSRCGRLLSLQLTTPGCAVARFGRLDDAQRCFQYFNGKRIDGFVIEACIT
ncbi:uncharacterized protein LOC114359482 isoform X2 [Ostrinia furnacalis]|uniref:uncharacterized protein LOC114359482 isoform X2 n=1 Tax=Ostrinia furnacalis TaxID=93504 RepID=UPI00103F4ED5|nr:uncharacterized protein LOC114359482 isoform X2 [Ostrinia furnacalis]